MSASTSARRLEPLVTSDHPDRSLVSRTNHRPSDTAEMTSHFNLLGLPPELLSYLFLHLSTASFVQTILVCKQLFILASQSRDAILAHLNELPGIKLGLDSTTISTNDLFLLVRQRASSDLYGAEFHADCTDVRPRSGIIDASASCLLDVATYFNISLALKESLAIRHCDFSAQLLKEHTPSPYADGRGRVVKVFQSRTIVSVLYAYESEDADNTISCPPSPLYGPIDPFQRYSTPPKRSKGNGATTTQSQPRVRHHLIHYPAYSADRPELYLVPDPPPLPKDLGIPGCANGPRAPVPIHLSIYSRGKCVIVWRVFNSAGRTPTDHTSMVILYETEQAPSDKPGIYTATTMIPQPKDPECLNLNRDASRAWNRNHDYLSNFSTKATAFAEGGHHIKLYHAGGVTPYSIIPVRGPMLDYDPNNVIIQDHDFRTDAPFYGNHWRDVAIGSDSEAPRQCELTYLALAWLTDARAGTKTQDAERSTREDMLFITQMHDRVDSDDCHHTNPSLTVIDDNATGRIVARLRGLSQHWVPTSMTALDHISISQNGTRIAIACWNKIVVYTLDPLILGENWTPIQPESSEDGSDDEDDDDDDNQSAGTQTGSEVSSHGGGGSESSSTHAGSAASNRSDVQASSATVSIREGSEPGDTDDRPGINENAMVKAARYYKLVEHPSFGEIVELWPTVLELPGDVVARKMMWGKPPRDQPAGSSSSGSGNESEDSNAAEEDADEDEDEDTDDAGGSATTNAVAEADADASHPPADPTEEDAQQEEQERNRDQDQDDTSNDKDDTGNDKDKPNNDEEPTIKNARRRRHKRRKRRKRRTEDELVVLTDRGLQLWNLGARAKGRRMRRWLWDA